MYLLAGGELTYYALVCAFTALPTSVRATLKSLHKLLFCVIESLLLGFKLIDDQRNGLDCLEM